MQLQLHWWLSDNENLFHWFIGIILVVCYRPIYPVFTAFSEVYVDRWRTGRTGMICVCVFLPRCRDVRFLGYGYSVSQTIKAYSHPWKLNFCDPSSCINTSHIAQLIQRFDEYTQSHGEITCIVKTKANWRFWVVTVQMNQWIFVAEVFGVNSQIRNY